jgi:Mlc titration factor MtfA (ptsG expression regulator)
MPIPEWTTSLSEAYVELQHLVQHPERTYMNPYAASSPAEFFSVMSEYFFTAPEGLNAHFPLVYRQLTQYYRQAPLDRQAS